MTLHGYAILYNEIAFADRQYEFVAPGAFSQFLAASPCVALLWDSHHGWTIVDRVELFGDSAGLAFKARIAPRTWLAISEKMFEGYTRCSVNFTNMHREPIWHRGRRVFQITQAEIDHIVITNSPAYRGTGVWPVGYALEDDQLVMLRSRYHAAECCRLRDERRARERWFAARQRPC